VIVGSVKRVADLIAEISAATEEQSQGIDQVNNAVTHMDQVVQQAAVQTEELSSTAQDLAAQARQLQSLVGRFRIDQETAILPTTPGHVLPHADAPHTRSIPAVPSLAKATDPALV
jgi:methyl-accepting chemotaxis protein